MTQQECREPNIALQLWKRWFEFSGEPFEIDGAYQYCFFCRNDKSEGHDKECVYVAACELVGAECK